MTTALEGAWYVVCTEPNMELNLVWRLQQIGREVYVPLVRKRVPVKGRNGAGHRNMRIAPRPMFPGYGFLPVDQGQSLSKDEAKLYRGFNSFLPMPGCPNQRAIIGPEDMQRVLAKNYEEHTRFLDEIGARRKRPPKFTVGTEVITDEGPFANMIGRIESLKGVDRVEVLFDLLKVSVPVDQLRAA